MSAATCGCDPEAFWVCEFHRKANVDTVRPPDLYTALNSALVDATNSITDVLGDFPTEYRFDSYRLLWTRLLRSVEDTHAHLQALEAHDARALAER